MKSKISTKHRGAIGRSFVFLWAFVLAGFGMNLHAQNANTYTFSASTTTFTPLVGGTATSLGTTADDAMSTAFPIGFNFLFNSVTYTQVMASSNGQLLFGTGRTQSATNNLATTTATQRPGVAPLWDDLQLTAGLTYQLSGTSPNQVLTVEWLNMEWNYQSGTPVISFQVKLYEGTNVIECIYRQEATAYSAGTTGGASIGIMGTSTSDFISLTGSGASPTTSTSTSTNSITAKPATGQVYTFTPPPPTPPSVSNGTYSNLTSSGLVINGTVAANAFPAVTASGIVVGTAPGPLRTDPGVIDSATSPVVTSGSFSKLIKGLTSGTVYYYRTYAENSAGIAYGPDSTFTTNASAAVPVVTKTAATNVAYAMATAGGSITNDGGAAIIASGIVYGTSPNPSIGDPGVIDSTTTPVIGWANTSSFSFGIKGLTPSTKYYYRAYAINSVGTAYSSVQDSFTTTAALMTTGSATLITTSQATLGGSIRTVTGTGSNATITISGIVLSTSANPTVGGPGVTDSATNPLVNTGAYTKIIAGLASGTLYHYRSYAINPFGTFYGADSTFTTNASALPPSVNKTAATNVAYAMATVGGTIVNDGGSPITASGVVFGLASNPSIGDPGVIDSTTNPVVSASAASFSFGLRNLTASTKYYYRAYAINSIGTTYSTLDSFTTTAALMTTGSASLITTIQASLGGSIRTVTGTGSNATITTSGIVLSTSPAPTVGGPGVTDSTSNPLVNTGAYSKLFTGLTAGTVYYYRSYAINPFGTFYGADSTFSTLATPATPDVTKNAATNVAAVSATVSGNILTDGGSTITASGVVYGTSTNPSIGDPGVVDSTSSPVITTGTFTFNPAGLTPATKYYFRAYAINGVGTGYSTLDSFTTEPMITSFPYDEGFELGAASWTIVTTPGYTNNWVLGTPAKTFLSGAHGGTNAWATKLTGSYDNNVRSYIVSPYLDFSAMAVDPVLRFYHKFLTEPNWDALIVEISINGGAWTKLDANLGTGGNFNTANSIGWYNHAGASGPVAPPKFSSATTGVGSNSIHSTQVNGWVASTAKLTGAAGQSVRVRFYFGSDGSGVQEGWAIDDIHIAQPVAPTVAADAFSNVTTASATLSGNIISNGDASITSSGIVYSTSPSPVIGGPGVVDSTTSPVAGSGIFSKNIAGLSSATTYYYRAYATNAVGTSYSADSSFTTNAAAVAPTINVAHASAVTETTASISATIVSDGGDPITASGIVYGTSALPAIGDPGVVDSTTSPAVTSGSFTISPAGLTHTTWYYYRSYAINTVGTSYSAVDSFRTAPIITVFPYSEDFENTAVNSGWSSVATTGLNEWVLGTPAKTFLNSAASGTMCWVTKTTGTYSNLHNAAVVSPQIDLSSSTGDAVITFKHKFQTEANWDAAILEISIAGGAWTKLDNTVGTGGDFNTTNSLRWYNNTSASGPIPANKWSGNSSGYTSAVNGWITSRTTLTGSAGQSNVKVRIRFGSDGSGVDEGWAFDDVQIELPAPPAVVTGVASNITTSLATLAGNITSNGLSAITAQGIVYSTTPAPVIGGPGVVDSAFTPVSANGGTFSVNITGLSTATAYYYRAYAINAVGTTYGADSTFTTNAAAVAPTVISSAATAITVNSASISGNITSDGGDPVTASGVVYSTTPGAVIGGPGVVDSATSPLTASGAFTKAIGGLTHSTVYYFRTYATNSVGTSYSVEDSFTTDPIITSFPYTQDFEGTANTGWTVFVNPGSGDNWVLGTPAKTFLNGAHSGSKAWVTKLTGTYDNNVQSAVTSPQIDFSSFTSSPVLRFYHKFVTEANWDALVVEMSIAGGAWTKVNAVQGTGSNFNTDSSYAWYNHAGASGPIAPPKFSSAATGTGSDAIYASQVSGWIESATLLTGAAGQSDVRVRFYFGSDGSGVQEGWALDDITFEAVTTPSTAATSASTSNITDTTTDVSWTNGNGAGRIVVARLTSDPAVAPVDYKTYTANNSFGNPDSTGLGNYVVYNGTASAVSVINLDLLTNYTYDIYEYNGKYIHKRYTAAASTSATTLPVDLISFTGTAKGNDAVLVWATASETNNKGFYIERSVDGRSFEQADFVKGAGNSTTRLSYSLTDAKAFTKANSTVLYYRLKQVDFNGKYTYSQIVKVNKIAEKVNALSVYPNPFTTSYSVSFEAAGASTATLNMTDMQGRIVAEQTATVAKGQNEVSFDNLEGLQAGVYFVKVTIDGETQVMKLVKH